jgi:leucine dehydrogenase
MSPLESRDYDGHEEVIFLDGSDGFSGFIAIHSTALGPAAGGCRMAKYQSPLAAMTDALRLSQGMSFKNAMADLPAGGGKAVIYDVDAHLDRAAVFEAFGAAVDRLRGRYVTAEDVGTSVADMEAVARRTRFVAGLPNQPGRAGGDPSPWTALGVFVAMQAAAGGSLAGLRVAVQGLGAVGYKLCCRLHEAGARLVVADVDADRVALARQAFGAEAAPIDRIHAADADVFSPNALGAILNEQTIAELGAPVVCGGANNQLATPRDGHALLARGITYAPDYVVNAGGIVNVMAEYLGEPAQEVEARVRKIGGRVAHILAAARAENRPPHEVADQMARERIAERAVAPTA